MKKFAKHDLDFYLSYKQFHNEVKPLPIVLISYSCIMGVLLVSFSSYFVYSIITKNNLKADISSINSYINNSTVISVTTTLKKMSADTDKFNQYLELISTTKRSIKTYPEFTSYVWSSIIDAVTTDSLIKSVSFNENIVSLQLESTNINSPSLTASNLAAVELFENITYSGFNSSTINTTPDTNQQPTPNFGYGNFPAEPNKNSANDILYSYNIVIKLKGGIN